MKSSQFLEEGFVEDAQDVHLDHEVQMARADCFHAAEDALALHKLLRSIDEQQGLEGWVSAKITLASDYLKTVREYLEYELMTGGSGDVEGNESPMTMPETLASPIETVAAPVVPVAENSAGSVATVVNPTPKNKAKVGSLFGGTYKQKKAN